MKSDLQTKYLIGFFVLLMISGMVAVISFGIHPRTIPKITFSQFSQPEIVANSLLQSVPQDMAETPIVFWGADPKDPFYTQILQNFLLLSSSMQLHFDAILVDSSFENLQTPADIPTEKFSLRGESERFFAGLTNVHEKNIHLLVVVPTVEASLKLQSSLISLAKLRLQALPPSPPLPEASTLRQGVGPMGLVLTHFPRAREEESQMQIQCQTGAEDRDQVADLGCLILQSSRLLYRKHVASGTWAGLLDQIGGGDFLFMLTPETSSAAH
jgi:hypothetical protein